MLLGKTLVMYIEWSHRQKIWYCKFGEVLEKINNNNNNNNLL